MKKLKLIVLIFLVNNYIYCQESRYQKDIELGIGTQIMPFQISGNDSYYLDLDSNSSSIVNLYVQLSYLKESKKDDNLFYKIGLGVTREFMFGEPMLPIVETGISNDNSLTILEISNLEYQLKIPLNISYALRRFKRGYGFQLSVGLEPRIRVFHIGTGNLIISNYDPLEGTGQKSLDEALFNKVNDYYFNKIKPFSLIATLGGGLKFPKEGASIGYKLNYMVINPFKVNTKPLSRFGVTFFGIYPLFDFN